MAEGGGAGGGNGRGYSGSGGGQVVSYSDLESLDVDHYDFINAPQFVDFADLAKNDDPNADLFFETHREEDDFMISIDSISPTVQLLQEQQNVLNAITQEVNQAAAKDGMGDVQVVYYQSPSTTGQRGRNTSSLNSSNGSVFYTPMGKNTGEMEFDNKENCAPSLSTPEFKDSFKEPIKKLSYSAAFYDNDIPNTDLNNESTVDHGYDKRNNDSQTPSKGLLAQLEKLQILSSDEEDAAVESIEENYDSPTKSMTTDESLVNSLLKTPGAAVSKSIMTANKENRNPYTAITSQKLNFFEGLSIVSPSPLKKSSATKAYLQEDVQIEAEGATMIKTENSEEAFFKNEFPVFQGPMGNENDDRKLSFLVEPSVGQEVVWSSGPADEQYQTSESVTFGFTEKEFSAAAVQHEYVNDSDISDAEADTTLTNCSSEGRQIGGFSYKIPLIPTGRAESGIRRSSSLSNLTSIQINRPALKSITKLVTATTGSKLTIPKSPDASKRAPSKCRNTTGKSVTTGSTGSSSSVSTKSYEAKKFIPEAIPYKGLSRPPMKAIRFVSLAEQVSKFQNNTPDRFRSLPRGKTPLKRSTSCELKPRLSQRESHETKSLIPSPSHAIPTAVHRSGANSVSTTKSTSESISRVSSGIPLKTKGAAALQRATIPQPFNLSTTKARTSFADQNKDVPDFKFKARPAPKTQGPVGVHERPQVKVTLPIAPHFASDDRIRERHVKKVQSTTQSSSPGHISQQPKASRIPLGNTSRPPSAPEPHKTTALKPFSFDQRNQEMLRRKEEKIKQEIEEEKRVPEFRANPLPNFGPCVVASTSHCEPFHVQSDDRRAARQQALKRKLHEEIRQHRLLTCTFHANPALVLHQPAFEPELPVRPPLECLDFQLNTEKRAAEREQFDNFLRQKELDDNRKREEEQMRLREQQRLEEIECRRQMVHIAQPFKVPKPFQVKASNRPLTVPQSPAFHRLPTQRRTTPTKNTSM